MKNTFQLIAFLITVFVAASSATPLPDSIGVKKVQGKDYILHQIENAEGWFSIARKYGITYAELRMANKDSADKLVPGSTLLVPADKLKPNDPFYGKNYTQGEEAISYSVKEGETLFSIARKFNTSVDSLKKWNRLSDADLRTGQRLKVGFKNKPDRNETAVDVKTSKPSAGPGNDSVPAIKKSSAANSAKSTGSEAVKDSAGIKKEKVQPAAVKAPKADSTKIIKTASAIKPEPKKNFPVAGKSRKEVYENGVASWIRDDDINPNKYYALHRSAPIGTIIKVTNKMNNKYVFVKVVGTLPNTGDNTDLVIKISKASAEKLGVRDSRFQSELNYGITEKP